MPSSSKLLKIDRCPSMVKEPLRISPVFDVLVSELVVCRAPVVNSAPPRNSSQSDRARSYLSPAAAAPRHHIDRRRRAACRQHQVHPLPARDRHRDTCRARFALPARSNHHVIPAHAQLRYLKVAVCVSAPRALVPVAKFVTVIVAPAITAFWSSRTVPTRLPFSNCAWAASGSSSRPTAAAGRKGRKIRIGQP